MTLKHIVRCIHRVLYAGIDRTEIAKEVTRRNDAMRKMRARERDRQHGRGSVAIVEDHADATDLQREKEQMKDHLSRL